MAPTSFKDYVVAVDRVEKRLRKVTAALDAAGIKHAVIEDNAVAAWVSRADPSATRSTKDVNLLVEKSDLDRITSAMSKLGFAREDLRSLVMFTDPEEPSRRSGVHLVWAGQLVRPSYVCPAPAVNESVRDSQGFNVLDLGALVRMKLTSNRDIDRVHVRDLLSVELITLSIHASLPLLLQERLKEIEQSIDEPI